MYPKIYKNRLISDLMKKSVLGIFLLIASFSFVSAQGLGELLDMINESTLVLSAVFIISFSLIFFSLQKFFKQLQEQLLE